MGFRARFRKDVGKRLINTAGSTIETANRIEVRFVGLHLPTTKL